VIKVFDVRATVVGEQIFAAKIDSQSGKSKLDWRMDYSVPVTEIVLPAEVASASLKLMRRLQLNYAAFDFCVDAHGKHWFLELNCGGQYLWVEQRAHLPISREIAELLAGNTIPICKAPS